MVVRNSWALVMWVHRYTMEDLLIQGLRAFWGTKGGLFLKLEHGHENWEFLDLESLFGFGFGGGGGGLARLRTGTVERWGTRWGGRWRVKY